MPEKEYWENLFNIQLILEKLEINNNINSLVEFGCGYGTFTIPSAKLINGNIIALDIDQKMINITNNLLKEKNIKNVIIKKRDFIKEGTGIKNNSIDYVMLFNILHHKNPNEIFEESYKILKNNGKLGVIHWNYDKSTPRGPDMNIRPQPEYLKKKILENKFKIFKNKLIDLPPHHYGFLAFK